MEQLIGLKATLHSKRANIYYLDKCRVMKKDGRGQDVSTSRCINGSDGTPLIADNEIEWLTSQSEYRPTEYIQGWMSFWFDEEKRLKVAKQFQLWQIEYMQKAWEKDKDLQTFSGINHVAYNKRIGIAPMIAIVPFYITCGYLLGAVWHYLRGLGITSNIKRLRLKNKIVFH